MRHISDIREPTQNRSHPCILCVDDSQEILLICQTVLEADGYQVFTAASGRSRAGIAADTMPIYAVVIDNVMPE